jgi:DNA repair protein RecO (recombination protein O)
LQPLTVLDLVVYKHEQKKLERISEMKPAFYFHQLNYDVVKSTIWFFMAEIIYKAIHEEECNIDLFDWMVESLQILDETENIDASFHLHFMLELSKHLGFYPHHQAGMNHIYFDLQNGTTTADIPAHLQYLQGNDYLLFIKFIDEPQSINNRIYRKRILQIMVEYFALHIPGFGKLKSPEILESVLG